MQWLHKRSKKVMKPVHKKQLSTFLNKSMSNVPALSWSLKEWEQFIREMTVLKTPIGMFYFIFLPSPQEKGDREGMEGNAINKMSVIKWVMPVDNWILVSLRKYWSHCRAPQSHYTQVARKLGHLYTNSSH